MVQYIKQLVCTKKKWLDEESFRYGVAFCQVVPGATAMQTCAYSGLRIRGVPGAIVCFVGFGLPAFIFMTVLSAVYMRAHDLPRAISAFSGLQAIIVAIVANSTVSFGRTNLKKLPDIIIALVAAGIFALKVNPIIAILLAAILGMILFSRQAMPGHAGDSKNDLNSTRAALLILTVSIIGFIFLFFADRPLFNLGILMARIDLFAFGGGFASVPLMFHEIVEVRSWMNGPTFMDGIAMGQITPGPIVITATFIGYLLYGARGAMVATISIFLPSFLMVVGIAPYFEKLRSSPYFNKTVRGILCSFVGLLLSVTIRFALNVHWDLTHIIIGILAFALLLFKVDILWVVLAGTVISMAVF